MTKQAQAKYKQAALFGQGARKFWSLWALVGLLAAVLLFAASCYDYLLFHIIAEFTCIIVAGMAFIITWNARKLIDNNFFTLVGIAFLSISIFDFAHAISYDGMNIIRGYGTNLPTALWITARYIESLTLLGAVFFISRKIVFVRWLSAYLLLTLVLVFLIFSGHFPATYRAGFGLTAFKVVSEYVISLILFAAALLLLRQRKHFQLEVLRLLIWALTATIISEMMFTLYTDPFGVTNLAGHYFKLAAYFLFYLALVVTGVQNPQKTLFRNLKNSEEEYRRGQAKYQILAEATPYPIELLAADFTVVYLNKAALHKYGFAEVGAVEGKQYLELVAPENREKILAALNKAMQGQTNQIDFERCSDGTTKFLFQETFIPVAGLGDKISRIFCISRDVTEEVRLNRAKTEFISLASHQLRNPLTSAGFGLEMLIGNLRKKGDIELAKDVLSDIWFMTSIVNKLLNISRIEMGTFTDAPERIELKKFFCEVSGGLTLLLKSKNVGYEKRLSAELPETIYADSNILKNIIQNLVMNAIRNTPEKGKVTLSARMEAGELRISVTDTGPGIPEETQPKIFSKMYKAYEMLEEESRSSGLGLYIAKLFTECLNGRIWFETEMGQGTTFHIQLPVIATKSVL